MPETPRKEPDILDTHMVSLRTLVDAIDHRRRMDADIVRRASQKFPARKWKFIKEIADEIYPERP